MAQSPKLLCTEVEVVIYHKNCYDGFGSRVIAEQMLGGRAVYIPATHGNPLPSEVNGKNVLIVDFSYPKAILDSLAKKAKNFLILDHHESAEKDLKDLPDKYKVFDMKRSGVGLTWEYFHGGETMPHFFELIENHDLWKEETSLFKEFGVFITIIPQEYDNYDKLSKNNSFELTNHIRNFSYPLLELQEIQIKYALSTSKVYFQKLGYSFYLVATTNATVFPSEIGNRLVTTNLLADFGTVFSLNEKGTKFSLRSLNDRVDTIPIAKLYGGGGHRNASGCSTGSYTNKLPGTTFDLDMDVFNTFKVLKIKDRKIISLCSPNNRHNLGSYLLSAYDMKVKDKNGKYENVKVQQWEKVAIYNKLSLPSCTQDIAVVWSYNVLKNETEYVFSFAYNLPYNELEFYTQYYELNDKNILTLPGLPQFVELDEKFK